MAPTLFRSESHKNAPRNRSRNAKAALGLGICSSLSGARTGSAEAICGARTSMAKGIDVLKEVRDDICGHVQEAPIRKTLNELANSDLCGILETGPTLERTYYKFAGELVVQILVRGVPDMEKRKALMEKLEKIGNLVQAFALIDRALDIYMEERNLLLRQQ